MEYSNTLIRDITDEESFIEIDTVLLPHEVAQYDPIFATLLAIILFIIVLFAKPLMFLLANLIKFCVILIVIYFAVIFFIF